MRIKVSVSKTFFRIEKCAYIPSVSLSRRLCCLALAEFHYFAFSIYTSRASNLVSSVSQLPAPKLLGAGRCMRDAGNEFGSLRYCV